MGFESKTVGPPSTLPHSVSLRGTSEEAKTSELQGLGILLPQTHPAPTGDGLGIPRGPTRSPPQPPVHLQASSPGLPKSGATSGSASAQHQLARDSKVQDG